jgi:hypothetical protein
MEQKGVRRERHERLGRANVGNQKIKVNAPEVPIFDNGFGFSIKICIRIRGQKMGSRGYNLVQSEKAEMCGCDPEGKLGGFRETPSEPSGTQSKFQPMLRRAEFRTGCKRLKDGSYPL